LQQVSTYSYQRTKRKAIVSFDHRSHSSIHTPHSSSVNSRILTVRGGSETAIN